MTDHSKIAANLRRFRIAMKTHDVENPTHPPARGVGVSYFDLERLGFEDGEEMWYGAIIIADKGETGNFRILCDFEEDSDESEVEEIVRTRAIGGVPV